MTKKISRRILKTELSVALLKIEDMNFGMAKKLIEQVLKRVEEYDLSHKDFTLPVSVEECESNLVDTGGQQLTTDERWAVEETYHFIESTLKGTK